MKRMLFFLLLSLLSSCLEVNKKEYIQKLDELIETTDSMRHLSKEINRSIADSLRNIRCGLLTNYTHHYPSDTITVETAQHIENIKYSCLNLRLFDDKKEVLKMIQTKHHELIQLKQMINKGVGDRTAYKELIQQESESVENLKNNFEQEHAYYINGIRNFEDSEHYLRELIEQ